MLIHLQTYTLILIPLTEEKVWRTGLDLSFLFAAMRHLNQKILICEEPECLFLMKRG